MKINEKKILLEKMLPRKEGILLDYVSFYPGIKIGEDVFFRHWEKYIQDHDTVPVKFYLHLPFCATICKYCMYNTLRYQGTKKIDLYIEDLIAFLERSKYLFKNVKFHGIYVGGGTPSILTSSQLQKLFSYVFSNFSFNDAYYKEIELNPSSTTYEKLDVLYQLGFTRISFGVQSLKKETLKKENRKFVNEKEIFDLVDHARNLGFLDINLDIIAGLNDESYEDILYSLLKIRDIAPPSVTVYTILKHMEKSALYQKSPKDFYLYIQDIYKNVLEDTDLLRTYDMIEWSNVLGFTLKKKGYPFDKLLYDAHNISPESIFGVGFKAFGKISQVGTYDTLNSNDLYDFSFVKNTTHTQLYSSLLQAFQFQIDKQYFLDSFQINIGLHFREELDYMISQKVITETDTEIIYIGDKNLIGYYGLLLLDIEYLIRFIKYRFYEKK